MPNYKTLGDAIGMPDAADKTFIQKLLKEYDKKHPGFIQQTVKEARNEQTNHSNAFNDITKFGVVDKKSNRRHLFELPEDLFLEIERYYPTMFREKKHFAWFCKNFKSLMLPEKH